MFQFRASLSGDKELDKTLRRLEEKIQKKIGRAAITKSLRILSQHMKNAIPSQYKELRKVIRPRFKKNRKKMLEAKVGANVTLKKDRQYKLARFLLVGTKDRYTKAGKYTGRMPEQDWLRDGFRAGEGPAEKRLIQGLKEGIEKEAKKK